MSALSVEIDGLLPQTQCTKCGYPSCRRYADAMAAGEADINQCPPGGAAGILQLAALLGRDVKPLNPVNGVERTRLVAVIDEARCIAMEPARGDDLVWDEKRADAARARFERRASRLERERRDRAARLAAKALKSKQDPGAEKKRAIIRAAIERARSRRART